MTIQQFIDRIDRAPHNCRYESPKHASTPAVQLAFSKIPCTIPTNRLPNNRVSGDI